MALAPKQALETRYTSSCEELYLKKLKNPLYIVIEGIDGSGKSTLAKNIFNTLSKEYKTILTKEPGGSQVGLQIRDIVQKQKLSPLAEFLLFAADRAQLFNELIDIELKNNSIVISDRSGFSSLAYQGYAKGLNKENINLVNKWAMQDINPDIIFYVKIDVKTARARINQRAEELTQFEQEKSDFMEKVKLGFDEIFKNKDNVVILDGKMAQEDLLKKAMEKILEWINLQN